MTLQFHTPLLRRTIAFSATRKCRIPLSIPSQQFHCGNSIAWHKHKHQLTNHTTRHDVLHQFRENDDELHRRILNIISLDEHSEKLLKSFEVKDLGKMSQEELMRLTGDDLTQWFQTDLATIIYEDIQKYKAEQKRKDLNQEKEQQ